MTTPILIYKPVKSSQHEFIKFWAKLYHDKQEHLYTDNIGRPPTPDRVYNLFIWKNGTPFSNNKCHSVNKNFIQRINDLASLPKDTPPEEFLKIFSKGGPIWRIFWLHCWQPEKFPIYDQHVHRAMIIIDSKDIPELNKMNDSKKISSYINNYIPFTKQFSNHDARSVDRALWAFGKLCNTPWHFPELPTIE